MEHAGLVPFQDGCHTISKAVFHIPGRQPRPFLVLIQHHLRRALPIALAEQVQGLLEVSQAGEFRRNDENPIVGFLGRVRKSSEETELPPSTTTIVEVLLAEDHQPLELLLSGRIQVHQGEGGGQNVDARLVHFEETTGRAPRRCGGSSE